MALKQHIDKLECHFTWDLEHNRNVLQGLRRIIQGILEQECTWLVHCYNLLGYIEQTLGFNTEALMNLHKAESVMKEQGTEEAGVRLQVNKANMAWVYFLMGDKDKSKECLEEVESLQQMYPAPPGCDLHPEVSGEKGWTLVKFNKSKKREAIYYFKMALKAEPERKEWHKGLAIAITKAFTNFKSPPEHKYEILKLLKTAHENDPNNLLIHTFYLEKCSEVQNVERQMQDLLEKALETGDLECLVTILRYYRTISVDKAIEAAERAHGKFPTSIRALKCVANCYKWKVYSIKKDGLERMTLAMESAKLFEEVVRHHPDSLREKVALASMHHCAHNSGRANEIYQQLLSDIDDFPPHSQQYIYYSYACHLHNCGQLEDSITFHMKAAETPANTDNKQKSIKVLQKTVMTGTYPHCEEIMSFLKRVHIYY